MWLLEGLCCLVLSLIALTPQLHLGLVAQAQGKACQCLRSKGFSSNLERGAHLWISVASFHDLRLKPSVGWGGVPVEF